MVALSDSGALRRPVSMSDNVSESNLVPSVNLIEALLERESSIFVLSEIDLKTLIEIASSVVALSDNLLIIFFTIVS